MERLLSRPAGPVPPLLLLLARRRWNIPVLARLHPDRSVSFGTLSEELHASREALIGTLTAIRTPGWVDRGTGRRGAYRLTRAGRDVATRSPPRTGS